MPNSLSEDMIELGEKYMLSPDDPQVVSPNGEPQHDNLQRLEVELVGIYKKHKNILI